MRIPGSKGAITIAAAAAAGALLSGGVWAGASTGESVQADGLPAVWTLKELRFIYTGFTASYSCDGLGDKITSILLALGAREDLEVREGPCTNFGQPESFPTVTIRMNVLEPVTESSAAATASAVRALWKSVDLPPRHDPQWSGADCELIEQVRQTILPAFAARRVEERSACVPHQAQIGAPHLRAEVLVVDPRAAKGPGG